MMMEELLNPLRAMLGVSEHSLEVESPFAGLLDAGGGADDDGRIVRSSESNAGCFVGTLWRWSVLCRTPLCCWLHLAAICVLGVGALLLS